jgi:hypothetical protein
MGLFTKQQLVDRFEARLEKGGYYGTARQRAVEFLNESQREQQTFSATTKTYDIFLSHSSDDAREVGGLKLNLEDFGYSVYVDWIEDPQLDRSNVTRSNAETLRKRMNQCKSLLYAFSENARTSTWMPWELGYFDGIKGKVAVLPVVEGGRNSFKGNEFVELYPYVDEAQMDGANTPKLWVNESMDTYVRFDAWLSGKKPYKRTT